MRQLNHALTFGIDIPLNTTAKERKDKFSFSESLSRLFDRFTNKGGIECLELNAEKFIDSIELEFAYDKPVYDKLRARVSI